MNNYLNFSGAHAVQVSTKLLAEKIVGYNSEVKLLTCSEELLIYQAKNGLILIIKSEYFGVKSKKYGKNG